MKLASMKKLGALFVVVWGLLLLAARFQSPAQTTASHSSVPAVNAPMAASPSSVPARVESHSPAPARVESHSPVPARVESHSPVPARVESQSPSTSKNYSHLCHLNEAETSCLPLFVCPGSPKCGTTTLYGIMATHPNFQEPWTKETGFLIKHYQPDWESNFPIIPPDTMPDFTADHTPVYLLSSLALTRMFMHLPNSKLIVMVREPLSRALSNFVYKGLDKTEDMVAAGLANFDVLANYELDTIEDCQERKIDVISCYETVFLPKCHETYPDIAYCNTHLQTPSHRALFFPSVYIEQLERWNAFFPKERFLVLAMEDLYEADQSKTKEIIARFLGIPNLFSKEYIHDLAGANLKVSPKPDPLPETVERIRRVFAPLHQRLYEWMGRDLGW